ncbi:MAG: trypsin-like peptidase domain-containing protein [Betaproteobacteria bacterium]
MSIARVVFLVASGLSCLASIAGAQPVRSVPGALFEGGGPAVPAAMLLNASAPAKIVALDSVGPAERQAPAKSSVAADKRAPLQIGFARDVPAGESNTDLGGLAWQDAGSGRKAARVVVRSPGAAGLRAHLALTGGSDGIYFRFAGDASGAPVFGPFTWAELEAAGRWSPVLQGSSAIIELELAAGAQSTGRVLGIARISHLDRAGADLAPSRLKRIPDIGSSGACNIDIACIANPSTDLLQTASSVAQIVFTISGSTFLCTGSLINSKTAAGASTQIPYFATANHCIGSAATAATINFFWFFEAATCDSLAAPGNFQVTTGGAALLYKSYDIDFTLLQLNTNPPQGAFLAGWDASPVFPGVDVIALHHPQGDLKKFSAGRSLDFDHDCDDPDNVDPQFQCAVNQGMYLRVNWSDGTTEPGSSGGGVYTRAASGQYQLRGVLHGGGASCETPDDPDYFGRLDLAFPGISQFLAGVTQPSAGDNAIEFYNLDLDHYFMTSFPSEVQFVESSSWNVNAGRGWVRTGHAFPVGTGNLGANSRDVCRFYGNPQINPATGQRRGPNSHFYTAEPAECAQVKLDQGWVYEAIAFTTKAPVGGTCPANTVPVLRLYNNGFSSNNSNHRYTTSQLIYDFMLTQQWSGESTVMCAPTSPAL